MKALDGLKIPEDLDGYEDLDSESQSQVEAVFKERECLVLISKYIVNKDFFDNLLSSCFVFRPTTQG